MASKSLLESTGLLFMPPPMTNCASAGECSNPQERARAATMARIVFVVFMVVLPERG